MQEFKELTNMEAINHFIEKNSLAFLFISRTNCSICHGLFPQVQALMGNYPNIATAHINAENIEEIAGRFSIFTVPVLLLFVDGKEYLREARIVHMDLFEERLNKIYTLAEGVD